MHLQPGRLRIAADTLASHAGKATGTVAKVSVLPHRRAFICMSGRLVTHRAVAYSLDSAAEFTATAEATVAWCHDVLRGVEARRRQEEGGPASTDAGTAAAQMFIFVFDTAARPGRWRGFGLDETDDPPIELAPGVYCQPPANFRYPLDRRVKADSDWFALHRELYQRLDAAAKEAGFEWRRAAGRNELWLYGANGPDEVSIRRLGELPAA